MTAYLNELLSSQKPLHNRYQTACPCTIS